MEYRHPPLYIVLSFRELRIAQEKRGAEQRTVKNTHVQIELIENSL
jgi:hypothetical protein